MYFSARGDAGLDALIDHGLGDGVDFVAVTGGDPFRLLVERIFPAGFVRMERLAVDGVNHDRHAGAPGRDPADDAGLRAVGVDDVELPLPEELFQSEIRLQVAGRVELADQARQLDRFERRKIDVLQQFPLPPR